jgi:hypothetical protein
MRKFISITLIGALCFSVSYAAVKKVAKGERKTYRFEPAPSEHTVLGQGSSEITMPNSRNGGYFALVDSSTNGYGMVSSNTRPLFVDPENTEYWFSTYRQFCGLNTTHGQLGGAFSEDGEDWTTYTNLNSNGNPPWGGGGVGGTGVGQARYPSAVGTEDMPIAVWNEYTAITTSGSLYGGRPYFAYDEFGWDGGSFAYPIEGDLLWNTDAKDLWVGSTSVSYDSDMGMPVINTVYNDWTRGDRWLFHSEYVDDSDIIMGVEQKVIDEVNDLVGGDDTGSFNTSPYVSCNPEGICGVGVVGLFLGADTDTSPVSNNHTGIFKMSENHGASWHGCVGGGGISQGCAESADGTGYYFIPDDVWDDLVATQFSYEYVDECEGTTDFIGDFWSYYEDDFKVDRDGNPHWSIQVLGCGAEFCYYLPEAGIYHFTIDREYLDNPGPVNTPTGWNWSFVMTGAATWGWADMTGETYIWNNHAPMAFSVEDRDIMYIATNLATEGDFAGDPANLEDPCYFTTWEDYPEWSEDLYILKSLDGGLTWSNPLNVTNTPDQTGGVCPNGYPKCDPAEEYPHTAQWATDDRVFVQYQMPNWEFNEIGDLAPADFMNRVYIGYAEVTDIDNIPEYEYDDNGGSGCYAEVGDVSGDGIINVLDIISLVNHVLSISPLADLCAADYSGDGIVNVLDIVSMVNFILGIGLESSSGAMEPADKVVINLGSDINLEYDSGNVQAVHLVLSSNEELKIALSENLFNPASVVSEYNSAKGETSIIAVTRPGVNLETIATIEGDYKLKHSDVVVVLDGEPKMLDAKDVTIADNLSGSVLPNGYRVSKAYPNPFNPSTSFEIDLDSESFVSMKVYNVIGQLTQELYTGNMNGYGNVINWDASNVSSGIYFVKIQVGNSLESQKVLLVK